MKTYGTLRFVRDTKPCWVLEAEPHIYLRAKRVFARLKDDAQSRLILRDSTEVCRDLEWFLERYPIAMNETDREQLTTGAAAHRDYILRLEELIDPNYEPPTFDLVLPARDYQRRGAAIALRTKGVLIADDVGLGKTTTSICVLTDPQALPAIVVTLAHLPKQWAFEINKFAPALRTHVVKQFEPYELPTFFGRGPDVVIINYHKLAGWTAVLAAYGKCVIFDEVQELRHATSQKYRSAHAIARGVGLSVGLSATPIYNFGGEIFNILNLLRPDSLGSVSEFGTEWCVGGGGEKASLKDPKAFGAWAREQFLIVRHTRKEVGRELPPVQRVIQTVDSDPKALHSVEANGQDDSVLAYFLVSEDGSDPVVAELLGLKREQVEGIRNPGADVLEELQIDPAHVRRLAVHYLTSLGEQIFDHELLPLAEKPEVSA